MNYCMWLIHCICMCLFFISMWMNIVHQTCIRFGRWVWWDTFIILRTSQFSFTCSVHQRRNTFFWWQIFVTGKIFMKIYKKNRLKDILKDAADFFRYLIAKFISNIYTDSFNSFYTKGIHQLKKFPNFSNLCKWR